MFFFYGATAPPPPVGQDLLIMEASRTHSDTRQSVGLFWTSDQPDAETTLTRDRHTFTQREFQYAIPVSERPLESAFMICTIHQILLG